MRARVTRVFNTSMEISVDVPYALIEPPCGTCEPCVLYTTTGSC